MCSGKNKTPELCVNCKYLPAASDISTLITLAVSITLSQQNISIIITLFNYVIIADAEGNLNTLLPKKKKLGL